jgi:hypothetical protein
MDAPNRKEHGLKEEARVEAEGMINPKNKKWVRWLRKLAIPPNKENENETRSNNKNK